MIYNLLENAQILLSFRVSRFHAPNAFEAAAPPSDVGEKIDMLAELREDNKTLVAIHRSAHETTSSHDDHATTSLIENWIDETERRLWFLFETTRRS
ncbi:ferritin-like domain-containing protein [Rhizobium leguminosarum]|nr:ferritin-like domain-containing protein [Rhizobium leguminosarum]